ncbi:MAG: hypothetical protein FWE20_07545 [Defluviitaleaceae bacterium]|nr:hypothetical protein [Defluviitaleaceae bacterium]
MGENYGDTHEAYFIYHNLLNILAAQMLTSGDFDPASINNEQISTLLTNLLTGRGSSGRDSTGQSFGGINDMNSYAEFRRLYAFLQNFDDTSGLDVAFVMNFFRHMDNHSDVSLTNISQSNVRLTGAGAVAGLLHDISDEESMFLFLSYVWATNSGRTYEESRSMFSFGQAGAGIILGAAGAIAAGAASMGAVRGVGHSASRLPPLQQSNVWTSRPVTSTRIANRSAVSNSLPNFERAHIDSNKLTGYALNPNHPHGGDKARVFNNALGYNQSNSNQLIAQVKRNLPRNEAVAGIRDTHGQRFTVDMQITGPNGNTAIVRTGWILDQGSDIPRLVTIYVR